MMKNKMIIFAGTATLIQAVFQFVFSVGCIAQYYCIIDFLRGYPIFLYIRILYFHNPEVCNRRITIGHVIPEIPDQAFVTLSRIPDSVTRTFILSCSSIGISFFWLLGSLLLLGTTTRARDTGIRWPWMASTIATLTDLLNYVSGTASGVGNVELNTSWAAWVMVLVFARFIFFFILNLLLLFLMIADANVHRRAPETIILEVPPTQDIEMVDVLSFKDEDEQCSSIVEPTKIPRVGLSKSFRRMKDYLFARQTPTFPKRALSTPTLPVKPPSPSRTDFDKKRSVNFPENLLSLPQRLENMIAEQQKRLDQAVIDTAGRSSPTRVSQSLPHLNTTKQDSAQTSDDLLNSISRRGRRRRSTVADLHSQLPWAYIDASGNRMRDHLPADEDLPPMPLPDYAALNTFRKASVHRAASSLSSLTQKRDEFMKIPRRVSPLTQSDVLY
ncbi:uncharacterized protein [Epargyreus clarus]|uniref:uncharacterized protein isoform X1 n=1 Tax=Epargyreus clarus TaxID=520877 RepID=UPI003C2D02F0